LAENVTKNTPDSSAEIAGAKFRPGQLVFLRSDPAKSFPVMEILPAPAGEVRYKVFFDNAPRTFYESQLQPFQKLVSDVALISAERLKAQISAMQLQSPSASRLHSLNTGRIDFVPYQYRPVLKLIRSDRPRLLIADEVGVGKTIEAGLILKELKARMDLRSVLILCTKSLVAERKWYREMKRFDEQFIELDGRKLWNCLEETDLEGQWPSQYAHAILPFSLFDAKLLEGRPGGGGRPKRKGLLELDAPPKFDLIVVDEAHYLRNSETWLHRGVRLLCDQAHAVVFLTATPIQLGEKDLYTLLGLLRPDWIIDAASFKSMADPNPHLNRAIADCRRLGEGWPSTALEALQNAAETEWGRVFLR
jgi:hypothetical protein